MGLDCQVPGRSANSNDRGVANLNEAKRICVRWVFTRRKPFDKSSGKPIMAMDGSHPAAPEQSPPPLDWPPHGDMR